MQWKSLVGPTETHTRNCFHSWFLVSRVNCWLSVSVSAAVILMLLFHCVHILTSSVSQEVWNSLHTYCAYVLSERPSHCSRPHSTTWLRWPSWRCLYLPVFCIHKPRWILWVMCVLLKFVVRTFKSFSASYHCIAVWWHVAMWQIWIIFYSPPQQWCHVTVTETKSSVELFFILLIHMQTSFGHNNK